MIPPTLETKRLVLRCPRLGDAADVYDMHRHQSVADGVLSIPHPCPDDHGEAWVRKMLKVVEDDRDIVWVIVRKSDQRVIGDCGIRIHETHLRAGMGYSLHPDHWGCGYMTEALRRVLAWGFTEREPAVQRFEADYYPSNAASRRVCDRLGMREEGTLRAFIRKDGVPRDVVRMAVLRDDHLDATSA